MNPPFPIVCPICSEPLSGSGRSYACPQRHNFDLSAEGYLSLLHGRGNYQHVGDDKRMVQARVRVHQLRPYAELAKALAEASPGGAPGGSVLDIGCGDGYFLNQVTQASGVPAQGVGIDVSKGALAKAARSYPHLFFVRADAAHARLPFRDHAFGRVLSVFAPRPIDEVRRVLRPGGAWLIATATPDHLRELRPFLPLAAIGTGKLDEPASRSYAVLGSREVRLEQKVAHSDLVSIVEMSPSIHRLRRDYGEDWVRLVPQELNLTFSFEVSVLVTTAAP